MSELTELKATEVIAAITKLANSGKQVMFTRDFGGNTLTVCLGSMHSHVGMPDGSQEQLIDGLHGLLCKGRGLSWHDASPTPPAGQGWES